MDHVDAAFFLMALVEFVFKLSYQDPPIFIVTVRQPQTVAFGHIFLAVENRMPQGRIQLLQFGDFQVQVSRHLGQRKITCQHHLPAFNRPVQFEVTKILAVIFCCLPGRQKLGIKIARGKLKNSAAVFRKDLLIAFLFPLCAQHTGNTVVICGNRHGPILQFTIIVLQQFGGGMGRNHRVAPLINGIANLHIVFAGGAGELPYAGSTKFTVGFWIK